MKLTPKQLKFANEYIKTGNATQSAIKAGYSEKTARSIGKENLTKPYIKDYVEEQTNKLSEGTIMDAQEAMELLSKIAIGKEKETVIISGPMGVEEHKKEADLKTRISAIKEILKRHPKSDELLNTQIRKLKAEAAIAEAKLKLLTSVDDKQMSAVDNLLNTIKNEVKHD